MFSECNNGGQHVEHHNPYRNGQDADEHDVSDIRPCQSCPPTDEDEVQRTNKEVYLLRPTDVDICGVASDADIDALAGWLERQNGG